MISLSLFPIGSGTPISEPVLAKDLRIQVDNALSPSAQNTDAANRARRLVCILRYSFKIGFHSIIYRNLLRKHLAYGMPACSPSLVADINHLVLIQTWRQRW